MTLRKKCQIVWSICSDSKSLTWIMNIHINERKLCNNLFNCTFVKWPTAKRIFRCCKVVGPCEMPSSSMFGIWANWNAAGIYYPATSISNALRLINQDVSFHQADWFLIQSIGKVISLGISTLCLAAAAVAVDSSRPTNNVFTFIHLFRYSFSRTFIKSILIFNRLQLFSLGWLCEWRMSVNIFKCMQIDRMCVCVSVE